jgi:hypothetical protein
LLLQHWDRMAHTWSTLGTGFLIKGTATFVTSGPDFDIMEEKFTWARATLAVTAESITQTL